MPTADPAGRLSAQFERRMLAVALAAGVLVATLAPLAYGIVARRGLRATATVHADELARALGELAARQPYLWPYNVPKVVLATGGHARHEQLASVSVLGCGGEVRIASEELGFAAPSNGPAARATIETPAGMVGWVEVTPEVSRVRSTWAAWSVLSALLGGLLVLALFIIPTRVVRRQYREIAEVTGRLRLAESELRETNSKLEARVEVAVDDVRRLSERVVRVQEEERARIARDLHDSLGQHLTAQRLELDGQPSDAPDRIARLRTLNDILLEDLRRAVEDLRPTELEGAGLASGLSSVTETFELRTGIPTSLRARGLDTVGERVATTLLRIAQEALHNVARHARADEVGVRCELDGDHILLEIRDDGVGGATLGDGHGLRSIRDRARYLGGTFTLSSKPGDGTTIHVRVPAGEMDRSRRGGAAAHDQG